MIVNLLPRTDSFGSRRVNLHVRVHQTPAVRRHRLGAEVAVDLAAAEGGGEYAWEELARVEDIEHDHDSSFSLRLATRWRAMWPLLSTFPLDDTHHWPTSAPQWGRSEER